jgi:hypothetical protein
VRRQPADLITLLSARRGRFYFGIDDLHAAILIR